MSSPRLEIRRLFLALWPGERERRAMAELAQATEGGRRLRSDKLHLTLVFLGATPAERLACYEAALRDIQVPSLTLKLDRLGCWRRSRILWLGTGHTPPPLEDLVSELHRRLVMCGFVPEPQPFSPHVTLARKFSGRVPVEFPGEPLSWRIDQIALVESVDRGDGVHYRVLRRWPGDAED